MRLTAIMAALALWSGGGALAATLQFDFVDMADGGTIITPDGGSYVGREGNWDDIVPGGFYGTPELHFRLFSPDGQNPFLDASTSKGPGGLGVCSSWSCVTGVPGAFTGDDNAQPGEQWSIEFNRVVTLNFTDENGNPMRFGGDDHEALNGGFTVNGQRQIVLGGTVAAGGEVAAATLFTFMSDPGELDFGSPGIYWQGGVVATPTAPVPLPAPALLLLGGIAVLGAASRRKRVNA